VQISASIGVARQDESRSEVSLMRRADLALYAAKREGRNRYRRYDAALEKVTKRRLSIENGMELALRTGPVPHGLPADRHRQERPRARASKRWSVGQP